jgi:hypothetical protein
MGNQVAPCDKTVAAIDKIVEIGIERIDDLGYLNRRSDV